MGKKAIGVTLAQWIIDDVIGETDNTSARVEELLIKAHMQEQKEKQQARFKKIVEQVKAGKKVEKIDGGSAILSRVMPFLSQDSKPWVEAACSIH